MGVQLDGMAGLRRTHSCGAVGTEQTDDEVTLAGWVHGRRDHGGVIFVDLRDRDGLVQVVFRPEVAPDAHTRAHQLRGEWVIAVRGKVERRSDETINPDLPSGEIEVAVTELRILNSATPPPFPIDDEAEIAENTRLEHRIHDLRRPGMQHNLRVRHELAQAVRGSLSGLGFTEIETPMLARSTPEGARDVLVPSRLQPGEFYALPQSPQDHEAAVHGRGLRPLLPDRPLLPRRGRPRRSPARVHAGRPRAVLHRRRGDPRRARAGDGGRHEARHRRRARAAVPSHLLPGGDGQVRHRSPRHARAARARRADGRVRVERVPRLPRRRRERRHREVPPHSEGRGALAQRDRPARGVRQEGARRQGARLDPGGGGRRVAEPDREVPLRGREGDDRRAHGARPGHVLFFQADTYDKANAILARLRVDLGEKLGRTDGREWDVLLVVDFPVFEKDEQGRAHLRAPAVRGPGRGGHRAPLDRAGEGAGHPLRRRDERRRARLGLAAQPPQRRPAPDPRGDGLHGRRDGGALRLHAARARRGGRRRTAGSRSASTAG